MTQLFSSNNGTPDEEGLYLPTGHEAVVTANLPVPVNGSVSLSQFSVYMNCPKQWYYIYVEHIPTPSSYPLVQGSIVHNTISRFWGEFRMDPRLSFTSLSDVSSMEKIRKSILGELMRISKEEENRLKDKGELATFTPEDFMDLNNNVPFIWFTFSQRIVWRLMNMMCREFASRPINSMKAWAMLKPVSSEKKYTVVNPEGKRIMTGYVDAIHKEEIKSLHPIILPEAGSNRVIIKDYKTSKLFKNCWKDEYEFQILVYAWMYWLETGVVPDVGIVDYLFYGKEVSFEINEGRLLRVEECLKAFINDCNMSVKAGQFFCNSKQMFGRKRNCDYCVFEPQCPKFPTGMGNTELSEFLALNSVMPEDVA